MSTAICPLLSKPAEISRESLPEVPRVHPTSGTACRLLTHRFKRDRADGRLTGRSDRARREQPQ
jgi:hypothetical protein